MIEAVEEEVGVEGVAGVAAAAAPVREIVLADVGVLGADIVVVGVVGASVVSVSSEVTTKSRGDTKGVEAVEEEGVVAALACCVLSLLLLLLSLLTSSTVGGSVSEGATGALLPGVEVTLVRPLVLTRPVVVVVPVGLLTEPKAHHT